MKRLYVRLAIVGVVLSLGTYAIIQSFAGKTSVADSGVEEDDSSADGQTDGDGDSNKPPEGGATSPPDPTKSDGDTAKKPPVWNALKQPIAPSPATSNAAVATVFPVKQAGGTTNEPVKTNVDGDGRVDGGAFKVAGGSSDVVVAGGQSGDGKSGDGKSGDGKSGDGKSGDGKSADSTTIQSTTGQKTGEAGVAGGYQLPSAAKNDSISVKSSAAGAASQTVGGSTAKEALANTTGAGTAEKSGNGVTLGGVASTTIGGAAQGIAGGAGATVSGATVSGAGAVVGGAGGAGAGVAGAAVGGAGGGGYRLSDTTTTTNSPASPDSALNTPGAAVRTMGSGAATASVGGAGGEASGGGAPKYSLAGGATQPSTIQGIGGEAGVQSGSGAANIAQGSVSSLGGTGAAANPAVQGGAGTAVGGYNPPNYQTTPPAYASPASNDTLSSATPGDVKLEGMQAPALSIAKSAPKEVQVDKEAIFKIVVRNQGNATAHGVRIHDQVPQGTRYIRSNPQAQETGNRLAWELGDLDPGDERTVELVLMPTHEGEIGSVATVDFRARAAVRTVSTKPNLVVKQQQIDPILIGQVARVAITIENTGSGDATGVIVEANVPEVFEHPAGRELENQVGTIRPGDTKTLELELVAKRQGRGVFDLKVKGEGVKPTGEPQQVEVTAPKLLMNVRAPSRRYLGRNATCTMTISNPGTATAHNIAIAARLPQGLEFVSAEGNGQYIAQQHAIIWSLAELAPNASDNVKFKLKTTKDGKLPIKFEASGDLNISHEVTANMTVESVPEVVFTISDTEDPIEVGSSTDYEIVVENRGTKAAEQIELLIAVPQGMQFVESRGPNGKGQLHQNGTISFPQVARLLPKQKLSFRVTLKGSTSGNKVLRAQIRTRRVEGGVVKEENTHVYQEDN